MVFARYTLKRFSWYFLGVSLFFAGLFNLVEFFEKLINSSSATIIDVTRFVVLHFGPSFVEFLPIASWLAAVLIIKEYHQRHELDVFSLIMIGKKHLCSLFLISGIMAGIFSFMLNEWVMLPISCKAERFRAETFKNTSCTNIRNKTMWLPDNIFAFIGFIDGTTHKGNDLTLTMLSPSFVLENIYRISTFKLDVQQKKILFETGYLFNISNNTMTIINNMTYALPSFFTTLQVHQGIPVLRSLIGTALFYQNLLSHEAYLDIMQQIIKRLLFYLQIILSPLLTIFIFFLAEPLGRWRWLGLLLPYGFFVGLNGLVIPLTKAGHPIGILILTSIIAIISIIIIKRRKMLD